MSARFMNATAAGYALLAVWALLWHSTAFAVGALVVVNVWLAAAAIPGKRQETERYTQ